MDVDGTALLRRNGSTYEGGQITFCNSDDTIAYSIDVYGTTASNSILRIIDEKTLAEGDTRGTQRFAINRSGAFGIGDVGNEDWGDNGDVLKSSGSGGQPYWDSIGGGIPQGVICMYSGSTAPSGWVICDNSSAALSAGAPDLRDKFIVGASPSGNDAYPGLSPGSQGGYTDAVTVAHKHGSGNYSTNSNGSHEHTYSRASQNDDEYNGWPIGSNGSIGRNFGNRTTTGGGNHNHNIGGNSDNPNNSVAATNRNFHHTMHFAIL